MKNTWTKLAAAAAVIIVAVLVSVAVLEKSPTSAYALEQTIEANLRCKQYGMAPIFSLMIGYPTETFEEMDMTIGVMNESGV